VTDGDAESAPVAPGVDQDAEVAPESKQKCSPRFLSFDPQGCVQLIGGLVIGLIALYSSYDHINVFGRVISLNKQQGVWFIAASLAVVFVDAQLASRSRLRAENEAAEARDRAAETRERGARQEAAQFRRARVEAEARQAQLAYLAQPSVANREQLEQVLSKLSRPEVRALFEDEALEKALGLRP
jgi:hypothetical protein